MRLEIQPRSCGGHTDPDLVVFAKMDVVRLCTNTISDCGFPKHDGCPTIVSAAQRSCFGAPMRCGWEMNLDSAEISGGRTDLDLVVFAKMAVVFAKMPSQTELSRA